MKLTGSQTPDTEADPRPQRPQGSIARTVITNTQSPRPPRPTPLPIWHRDQYSNLCLLPQIDPELILSITTIILSNPMLPLIEPRLTIMANFDQLTEWLFEIYFKFGIQVFYTELGNRKFFQSMYEYIPLQRKQTKTVSSETICDRDFWFHRGLETISCSSSYCDIIENNILFSMITQYELEQENVSRPLWNQKSLSQIVSLETVFVCFLWSGMSDTVLSWNILFLDWFCYVCCMVVSKCSQNISSFVSPVSLTFSSGLLSCNCN